jgi:NAD(P)-dependent dehydrogenase (short-subunit alcohol dehydrogenase family)
VADELRGRAALVTGASQGLGKEIVAEYLRAGASVVACARDAAMLDTVERELAPLAVDGAQLIVRPCDISKPDQVEQLVGSAIEALPQLDILVNSAGVYGPKGLIEDNEWSSWVQAIEINLFGMVLLCRSVLPHLKRRRYGKIVQLSGGGATAPMPRLSAYATSKAAVVRFCESLALEVADDNIDVNCIAPGALNTRMLDEVLEAGPDRVGKDFYERSLKQKQSGGVGFEKGAALAVFLGAKASDGISGRLLSAQWDPWAALPEHRAELAKSDIYTLRRITARERGKDWEAS